MEKSKFFQGLWSFDSFEHYLDKWIKPNILGDLETIFTGTAENWVNKEEPENDRGDFMLTTLLFSVFDHLGGFLAKSTDSSLTTLENISRIARRIPSIKGVDLIIAFFGRHALVHSAWPDTMIFVEEKRAFGLNIYAYPDIGKDENCKGQHMLLYRKKYSYGTLNSSDEYEGTKLRINIHHLRTEFKEQIVNGNMFADVNSEVFIKIKKIAFDSYDKSLNKESLRKSLRDKHSSKKGSKEIENIEEALIKQILDQMERYSVMT